MKPRKRISKPMWVTQNTGLRKDYIVLVVDKPELQKSKQYQTIEVSLIKELRSYLREISIETANDNGCVWCGGCGKHDMACIGIDAKKLLKEIGGRL